MMPMPNTIKFNKGEQTMNWEDREVLVTGGASFIGSHLVDAL